MTHQVFNPDPNQRYDLIYPGYTRENGERVPPRIVKAYSGFSRMASHWSVFGEKPPYLKGVAMEAEPRFYDLDYMSIQRHSKQKPTEQPSVTLAEFLIQALPHGKHWGPMTLKAVELMAGKFEVEIK